MKNPHSKYYGNGEYDENDKDSAKLILKDCRRRQLLLYTIHPAPHSPIAYFLSPLSKGELLYASGQSRLHLHLLEDTPCVQNEVVDFVLFEKSAKTCKVPKFPTSLDEEAASFRSHGLPLLVWPKNNHKVVVQKYLDRNYPDCGLWFRELDKCQTWLREKWVPLANYLDLETSADSKPTWGNLIGLPPDSLTAIIVKKRTAWLFNYSSLLQSYLVHRRIATPGFHHNPIHRQLTSLHEERQQSVADDSGFFNVVGDRLLQLGKTAAAEGKKVKLRIHEMAKQIDDAQQRSQFLSALLPMDDLRNAISQKDSLIDVPSEFDKMKNPTTEALSDDSEGSTHEFSGDNEDESTSEKNGKGQSEFDEEGMKDLPVTIYPNRPISKEIMDNRGIVKYRHKRERNPRVHLRYKFKKAQIRYKSRVPKVRKEDKPYAGELRGIRVNMIKSHKFKKPV